jgi:hypothetical protein
MEYVTIGPTFNPVWRVYAMRNGKLAEVAKEFSNQEDAEKYEKEMNQD